METRVAELALQALIHEVSLSPKPGLVCPNCSGSHQDMNYSTFLQSAFALYPGFIEYYSIGKNHHGSLPDLLTKIRQPGIRNEERMFSATQGINTHKGANFIFGILLALIGNKNNPSIDELPHLIREMTFGLVSRELQPIDTPTTHGELQFLKHQARGIRGEVEDGLPHVFEIALPILLNSTQSFDTSCKLALNALIATNHDSNMIRRGGLEGLEYGKSLSNQQFDNIDDHFRTLNVLFMERNLSPGGSADLLATAIFLYHYHNEHNN